MRGKGREGVMKKEGLIGGFGGVRKKRVVWGGGGGVGGSGGSVLFRGGLGEGGRGGKGDIKGGEVVWMFCIGGGYFGERVGFFDKERRLLNERFLRSVDEEGKV